MKVLYIAIIAAVAAVGIFLGLYAGLTSTPEGKTYSAGNFTVNVIEDTSSRFLARVENSGPALSDAGVFGVKKGLNANCEPQGVVVANFQVRNEDGAAVPDPNSIPANSSVTLDSRQTSVNVIPTGPEFETTVYVLGLEPRSVRANELIQKIPVQQPDSSELELFERCIDDAFGGYPVQLKLLNPQRGTEAYIALTDASTRYETAVSVRPETPDTSAVFWPASKRDWLSANYTQPAGPAPSWREASNLVVSVRVVSQGEVFAFEDDVTPRLVTTSLDFFELAKGNPLPSYPRYWEVEIDLANRTLR